MWPTRLPELPRYDDRTDQFVCPSCGGPLSVGESRAAAIQLIVFLHGSEQFRLLLEEGEQITIGRTDADRGVGLASRLPSGAADAISRAHASFALHDGQVVVEDLNSRNGTVARSVDGRREQRLGPGVRHVMERRETIVFPSGIAIELSGRSVPFDLGGCGGGGAFGAEVGDQAAHIATRP